METYLPTIQIYAQMLSFVSAKIANEWQRHMDCISMYLYILL